MAINIQLKDFAAKTVPVTADIVYVGNSEDSFNEVKSTIAQIIGAYPALLTIGELTPVNSAILLTDETGELQYTSTMTDGQLVIGVTGDVPVATTLTAGSGISITNAAGAITIRVSGGGLAVATIAGTSQAAAVNTMYIALNAGQTTLTLPAVYAVGDVIMLVGATANTGGWLVTAAAGDTVIYNGSTTSAGGTLTSSALAGQAVELVADVANSSWVVVDTVNTTLTTA